MGTGIDYTGYPISQPTSPPPRTRKRYLFWATPHGDRTVARVLISQMVAVDTHYVPELKRSVFCGGCEGGCMVNHELNKPRSIGYLLVELKTHTKQVVIWHATPECLRTTPELWDRTQSLAGAELTAGREGRTSRSPMFAKVVYGRFGAPSGGKTFDLLAHLVETFSQPNNDERRRMKCLRGAGAPPSHFHTPNALGGVPTF